MTELSLAILAATAIIWWIVLGRMKRRLPRQKGAFDVDKPGNWVCDNDDCPSMGLVYPFCGEDPTCPQCGLSMLPVKASYWGLEKRMSDVESAVILHYADGETVAVKP